MKNLTKYPASDHEDLLGSGGKVPRILPITTTWRQIFRTILEYLYFREKFFSTHGTGSWKLPIDDIA
jgi:hypothetical protein